MNTLKLKKGDTVIVMKGKDHGKKGKIIRTLPVLNKVVIEGVNEKMRHTKARRGGEKGQRVTVIHPVWAANVQVLCPACDKITRVGYESHDGVKSRICKKCKASLT